ncbi:hypothetical protein BV898_19340 [Hypsibius exemplaris]|uniref:Uncharacterized protein n=1 Tax=Hypsibius exemplaris TaxID=2072580 RepID=A0A9X6NLJ5_HYPEX|nr:hypothetical protein BV898_19340 [Hypsibius exemplaris]
MLFRLIGMAAAVYLTILLVLLLALMTGRGVNGSVPVKEARCALLCTIACEKLCGTPQFIRCCVGLYTKRTREVRQTPTGPVEQHKRPSHGCG